MFGSTHHEISIIDDAVYLHELKVSRSYYITPNVITQSAMFHGGCQYIRFLKDSLVRNWMSSVRMTNHVDSQQHYRDDQAAGAKQSSLL